METERAKTEDTKIEAAPPEEAEIEAALAVLTRARELPDGDPRRLRLEQGVVGMVKDGQRRRRALRRRRAAAADRAVLAATATASPQRADGLPAIAPVPDSRRPESGQTRRTRRCYACRAGYRQVDAFYHALCPPCADLHHRHREARTDLTGRSAVVSGGRVKIGFQTGLKLLRDGARVTILTRFPTDAARRYAAEPDSSRWLASLHVLGVDLRDPRQVLDAARRLRDRYPRLDILVNNAAQTVRRPAWAYQPLAEAEAPGAGALPTASLPADVPPAAVATLPIPTEIASLLDATGALVDPSPRNSWSACLGEIDPVELLEVQLVNVVAPFLLVDRLRPALADSGRQPRYVINVTGREGWFTNPGPPRHPHTAVAKAALNMLTRAGAPDLVRHGVHMCAVDTGWVSDESPAPTKAHRHASGWRPPLDVVDAAARIYHPVIQGESGTPISGVLLRDYTVVDW